MENISWKDHMTNEYVLDQVKEKRKLLNTILERKKRWLGNILRGENFVKFKFGPNSFEKIHVK
jgi:hypothetical protein